MEHIRENEALPARQATQVDEGWRAREAQGRQATQVDEGWRTREAQGRQATQVDEGWRAREAQGRQATQVDEGWRRTVDGMLDSVQVMSGATARAYAHIDEFRQAVEELGELVSSAGTRYAIQRTLSREGGESAVLLCTAPDGREAAAKVYFEPVDGRGSSIEARTKVLEYMSTEEGQKYTLAVREIGLAEVGGGRYYFEITPYCREGDLSGRPPYSFEEIVALTEYLNEALHSMHSAGILHRDLKPENLYLLDGRVVIGDFGVAKLARAGATVHTAGTDGYRAPETVLAVSAGESAFFFDEASDYYSLGVTLGSLFEGRFVYQCMTPAMVTLAVRQGRLPLTRTDPHRRELENLLCGLCRYDSRYRFGYADVKRWLEDHSYTGGAEGDEWPRPFRMLGEEYRDEQSLFEGITKDAAHWKEGVELLYEKYFENFFKSFRPDLARAAQKAEETWRMRDRDKGLAVFLKHLFTPGPLVWKGYVFAGLRELAEKMRRSRNPSVCSELLQRQCVSHWLDYTQGIQAEEETKALVRSIEDLSQRELELAGYWFENSFCEQRALDVGGRRVSSLEELLQALFQTPDAFYDGGCKKLMSRKAGADLYGFLYSFGLQEMAEAYWAQAEACDEFNRAVLLLSMLDAAAQKAGADAAPLRHFFTEYGPVGIAVYTKRLVERGKENPVYQPLNAAGKQLLEEIAGFHPAAAQDLDGIYRAYAPLLELVKKLQLNLADNPFCVSAGIYENRNVLCVNLAGCFAFALFGRSAPLGFQAWLAPAKTNAEPVHTDREVGAPK